LEACAAADVSLVQIGSRSVACVRAGERDVIDAAMERANGDR
jgi:hypothetical protein